MMLFDVFIQLGPRDLSDCLLLHVVIMLCRVDSALLPYVQSEPEWEQPCSVKALPEVINYCLYGVSFSPDDLESHSPAFLYLLCPFLVLAGSLAHLDGE